MIDSNDTGWKGKTRGGSFGYLFFILLIKGLGVKAAYAFLCLVVVYFVPFAPKATRAIWQYARQRLGYARFRSARFLLTNYYRLGQTLIDKVAVGAGMTKQYKFDFGTHYQDFLEVLNGNEGVVMIGAHVGNWEVGAPFFDEYGKKMNIVMFDAEYQKIKELLEKNTNGKNYKVIPVNEDNLTHIFRIRDVLGKGEYVCFQGDRYVEGSQVFIETFLGKEAAFPAGPFLLASRLGVPVVFYFAVREKGMRYKFNFVPAQPEIRVKGKTPGQELLKQYVSSLESLIKQYPEQWFNYYDFWK